MYLGHAVTSTGDEVKFHNPLASLYQSADVGGQRFPIPIRERNSYSLEGELPSPISPPSGCVFRTRVRQPARMRANATGVLEGKFRHAVCLKVDPVISQGLATCQPFF